jgi:serine/threonine protein phosphatase PrpC
MGLTRHEERHVPIAAFGTTDVGRERTLNEDFMLMAPELGLFVVCDGMGGHAAGEVASSMTARIVHDALAQRPELLAGLDRGTVRPEAIAAALRQGVELACQQVFDAAAKDRAKRGMGTTCTAAVIRAGKLIMAHVGDSRLLLCRRGQVSQLSQDHTFVAEAIKQGVLRPGDPRAEKFGNVVTRAVGPQRTVLVDVAVLDVVVGDTVVLCSDGLHQYFPDPDELARHLDASALDAIPSTLVALANERGGSDNITALVARITSDEAAASESEKRRTDDVLKNIDVIRHVELMRELTMAEVMRLAQAFEDERFDAGDFILREGEISEHLYVLVKGSVEVTRGERRLATLPAGSHFGEMALLNLRPRSATVRALEDCRMLTIDRQSLYDFLKHDGMLAAKFFWKMAQILSLRLDDAYEIDAPRAELDAARTTIRFGQYPSVPGEQA